MQPSVLLQSVDSEMVWQCTTTLELYFPISAHLTVGYFIEYHLISIY